MRKRWKRMKVYDPKTPVKGPVNHTWFKDGPPAEPSENYSLMELQTSPGFRLTPTREVIQTGENIVLDIESQQEELKHKLLYGLLQGDSDKKLMAMIKSSYPKEVVMACANSIKKVLSERGVFGRVYIDSKLFPKCKDGQEKDLVRRHASKAAFIKSKRACAGCIHNSEGMCLSYEKELVNKVPYDSDTLKYYRSYLVREKGVDPVSLLKKGKSVKEALKTAFRKESKKEIHVAEGRGAKVLPKAQQKFDEVVSIEELVLDSKVAKIVLAQKNPDLSDYKNTQTYQKYAVEEKGLFGNLYVDLNLFKGDCHKAKKFLDRCDNHAPFVISHMKCDHFDSKTGKCVVLNRYMVEKINYDSNIVASKAIDAAIQNEQITENHRKRIFSKLKGMNAKNRKQVLSKLGSLPKLVVTTRIDSSIEDFEVSNNALANINLNEGHNNPIRSDKNEVLRKEIRQYTAEKMNEGYYGSDLYELLRFKFGKNSLSKAKDILKASLTEQGLQGIYYVDPSVYTSCDDGSKIHRTRGTRYVKEMKACKNCVANSEGVCQKYGKEIVSEVPYLDKKAQQEEILNRNSSESLAPEDVFSYQSVLDQFEIDNMNLENFSIDEESKTSKIDVNVGGGMVLDWD